MNNELQKKYGLPTATALVVGIVIGSGVFFKAKKSSPRPVAVVSHGKDVLSYLIVFAAVMALAIPFYRPEAKAQ